MTDKEHAHYRRLARELTIAGFDTVGDWRLAAQVDEINEEDYYVLVFLLAGGCAALVQALVYERGGETTPTEIMNSIAPVFGDTD